MVFSPTARARLYAVDGKWPRKVGFRAAQSLLSIGAIGCAAAALGATAHKKTSTSGIRTVAVYLPPVALTAVWNLLWAAYLVRKCRPLNGALCCIVHFFFTIAFVIIGPYTTATVNGAYQQAAVNLLSRPLATTALVGCFFTDGIALCHLILFFWCLGDSAFGLKPREKEPAEEIDNSQPKGVRISRPISVVKNPPPVSATEKAVFEAKAAILGEKSTNAGSPASNSQRSSLSLAIFEEKPERPRVALRDVRVGSVAETSPNPSPRISVHDVKKINRLSTKPATSSPLRHSALSTPRPASPLSTSKEFQQQYPQLSRDLNNASATQTSQPAPPDPPAPTSVSKRSSIRLSWGLRNGLNSATSQTSSPEASRRSSQQQAPLVRPPLRAGPSETSAGSSTPVGPTSIRMSMPISQPPAAESSPKAANISVPRDPKSPTRNSTPPIMLSPTQSPSLTADDSVSRPRPFSWRGTGDVIEVVKVRSEPLLSPKLQTPPSTEPGPPQPSEHVSNASNSDFVADAVTTNPPKPVPPRMSEYPLIQSRASLPTITAYTPRSPGFTAEVLFAKPPETDTQEPQPPPATTQVPQPQTAAQVSQPPTATREVRQPPTTAPQASQAPTAAHDVRQPRTAAPQVPQAPTATREAQQPPTTAQVSQAPTVTREVQQLPTTAPQVSQAPTVTREAQQPPTAAPQVSQAPTATREAQQPPTAAPQASQAPTATGEVRQPPSATHGPSMPAPSKVTPESLNSFNPPVRISQNFNPGGSISQSFTVNEVFPALARPASYRGVEQMTYTPGSRGISPQMLRISNANRLSGQSTSTATASAARPGNAPSKNNSPAIVSPAAQARNAKAPKINRTGPLRN